MVPKNEKFVAIKGVSIRTQNEGAVAAREIAILSQLNHPNIIRLLRGYEPVSEDAKGRYMVLSFVDGPDIGELLEERGALGIPLAQLITKHVISAVAYCHTRGVLHRDIKPDNILLEGCLPGKQWINDNLIWSDGGKCTEAVKSGRFKAILADFGFARALTPAEYKNTSNFDAAGQNLLTIEEKRESKMTKRKSRFVVRGQSAVGTKYFAAPEIQETIRVGETASSLAPCVSDYSMISDAYSVGMTMLEIITGVPPGEDVDLYVHVNRKTDPKQSTTVRKLANKLGLPQKKTPQKINLRYMEELPEQAIDLIQNLTKPNVDERLSVREAQNHKWVGGYDALPHGDVPSRPGDSFTFLVATDPIQQ
mmetsp:Transcript_21877/g.45136  ORF Transcript_21877/g.45136 Transcript_21877/m.45136 type:complete len:365 (+) Transcript_21877:158-1252(+)